MQYDLAILGSGFGGSITALIAKQLGMNPILIERGQHPRFSIGESSTPQADIALATLADKYNLPRLKPFARYGTWKETYPEIMCGPKRGFTYISHPNIENELLISASPNRFDCDTHWYRSDFDAFLVNEVRESGIPYIDNTEIHTQHEGVWQLTSNDFSCTADFIIDATGGANPLRIPQDISTIRTNSRALYSHFEGVIPWGDLHGKTKHPYPCHESALHHIFYGGWMYVLHFDNGVTSAGFVLDNDKRPSDTWEALMNEFPYIKEQFQYANALMPIKSAARLQRRAKKMVGKNWAMLPSAAAFVDPLHSAGNAHTLFGIEKLMSILIEPRDTRFNLLQKYQEMTFFEYSLLDTLIHGCYQCFGSFEDFSQFSMLYFSGADFAERQRRKLHSHSFLNSGDAAYCQMVHGFYDQMRDGSLQISEIENAIEPWNMAGLCDPEKQNMYDYA